ncbi:MAG: GNAT family N-acetyltransferase [Moorea sp. SIO3I7]|nr:GNAT family N-acetyltransferase [Moorena sp. SIO3I7]
MTELKSDRLIYRTLKLDNVTETYVSWLNDPDINRYLEIRYSIHNLESCGEFVRQMNADPSQYLLGMFMAEDNRHIGNIKLGFIQNYHLRGQLSLLIGDKTIWGKGLATEAIRTVTKWGFETLGLARIEAGCYEENLGSLKAFIKAGYQVEGFFRKHSVVDGRRSGSFWLGVLPYEVT